MVRKYSSTDAGLSQNLRDHLSGFFLACDVPIPIILLDIQLYDGEVYHTSLCGKLLTRSSQSVPYGFENISISVSTFVGIGWG